MKKYEERKFNLPELKGISKKAVEEHLKLYGGYVKNTNLILEKIDELAKNSEVNGYALGEVQRRFGFEFGGMRNHEYYFGALEEGPKPLSKSGNFLKAIGQEWGSFENWLARFKAIGLTRGIGWAMLYYDKMADQLLNTWVDEQHMGHLVGLSPIVCLDMFEHSYMIDYVPGDKKKYIEAYFENLNWKKIEENFEEVKR
jgi:Fe-Mn family superoxide dismutase